MKDDEFTEITAKALEKIGVTENNQYRLDKRKPNFSEIQDFHKKMEESFYGDYFIKQGVNEFEFESYLI